ncbi:sodium:calcium antiporter [Candidatus Dojkabacteria bacterium]|nr:sodium:calcium antiporter [Candidatus Dojkabacteria bacterium]
MIFNIFLLILSLFLLIKGATLSTVYAAKLAESFKLSKYTVGFIIVAMISILPETFIAIDSTLEGESAFGLATLFGSNITDLTLIFAIIIFVANRGLKVETKILKNSAVYPLLLILPLILGLNGHFSRIEGLALILAGCIFYFFTLRDGFRDTLSSRKKNNRLRNFLLLLFSTGLLLLGSHFAVNSAIELAHILHINPLLIGMFIVGIGTTMPEFVFALKSVRKKDDSLAVGDILGTVLADATIVVGILALINPFSFPQKIIYVTGVFMVVASFTLFHFMLSGRSISRRESYMLLALWIIFIIVELYVNT